LIKDGIMFKPLCISHYQASSSHIKEKNDTVVIYETNLLKVL